MSILRLSSPVRLVPPEPARPRRRRGGVVGVSLLLHALLLAALLMLARRPDLEGEAAPSYQLMFEGAEPGAALPQGTSDTIPNTPPAPAEAGPPPPPTSQTDVLPGPPTPPAVTPPVPDAPSQPPTPPAPDLPQRSENPGAAIEVPASPSPPVAAPAPAPLASAPPLTAPALPATPEPAPIPPSSSSRPEVRLELPPLPSPVLPPVPDLVLPTPPMPPPQTPARTAAPRPRPAAPPPPATGTFANPMDLNFGSAPTRLAAPRSTAPRGSVASRSLDLSPGTSRSSPSRTDVFFDARAAKLGADWEEGLKAYWLRHRYYPRQAAEDGEDGTVELELKVDGSGRVQSAAVKSRSGSTWIDMAAVGTWRNAQLPPLPPELPVPYTFSITINYILIR